VNVYALPDPFKASNKTPHQQKSRQRVRLSLPKQLPSHRTHYAEQTGTEQQHRARLWDGGIDDTCIVQAKRSAVLLVNSKLDVINTILQIWSQLWRGESTAVRVSVPKGTSGTQCANP
jgi:hypothetical protein